MANGFKKLRLVTKAGVFGVLAGLVGGSRTARAVTTLKTGGARWGVFGNVTSSSVPFPDSSSAFAAGVASSSASSNSVSSSTTAIGNVFRSGMACRVQGVAYQNPGGRVTPVAVAGGQAITPAPVNMGGLSVQLTYFASSAAPILRGICAVTNTTASQKTVTVQMGSRFNSRNRTVVDLTASGGPTLASADNWFWSNRAFNIYTLTARFGTNAGVKPGLVSNPAGTGNFIDSYTLNIEPGTTARFMQLAQVSRSVNGAAGPAFMDVPSIKAAGLLSDLSQPQIDSIVNFSPALLVIPALDARGGMALVVLVGSTGMAAVAGRRRRRRRSPKLA